MNEVDSMFAKTDSLVEVPYVEPSLLGSLNVKSMIPRSYVIKINDMNNIMCYMNYDMCYVYTIMYCVQNVKYDGACYYHRVSLLIQILEAYKLS